MPLPYDFLASLIAPRERIPSPDQRPGPLSDLPGMIMGIQQFGAAQKARREDKAAREAQLRAAGLSDAEARRQQMEIEMMKEGGRGERAGLRNKVSQGQLDLERQKFAGERDKEDEKLWDELRKAETQGDSAAVEAITTQLRRKGYEIGDASEEMSAVTSEANRGKGAEAGADPELSSLVGGRKEYVPPTGTVEALEKATGQADSLGGGAPPPKASPAPVPDGPASFDTLPGAIDSKFKDLESALKAGGGKGQKPEPPSPQGKVGTNLDSVPGAIEDKLKGLDAGGAPSEKAPKSLPGDPLKSQFDELEKGLKEEEKRKGLSIRKDGKEVYRSPQKVDEFQKRKVDETFKVLAETAGDPFEVEAAEIGKRVAMGNLGAMSLENALKSGMDAYDKQTARRYKKDRVGTMFGGPSGGPALNKKKMDMLGSAGDDLGIAFQRFQSNNNYKQMEQAEQSAIIGQELLSIQSGTADAAALGQLVKSTEGGRPTDADREVYLKGQGALSRLKQTMNYYTSTGETPIMTDQMRQDIATVTAMNQSAANNKRRKLAQEWEAFSGDLESVRQRYGDDKTWEKDRRAYKGSLLQGADKKDSAPDQGMTPERAAARKALDAWKASRGMK